MSNKTLFAKAGGGLDLAHGLLLSTPGWSVNSRQGFSPGPRLACLETHLSAAGRWLSPRAQAWRRGAGAG